MQLVIIELDALFMKQVKVVLKLNLIMMQYVF